MRITIKSSLYLLFLCFFASCSQKNANPEQLDDIYKDLVDELGIVSKALGAEENQLNALKNDRTKVVPQTGKIKFINKQISDSEEKISVLKQQKQYFEIKIEQRQGLAKLKYEESLRPGGKPWPDEQEQGLYKSVIKFRREKIAWEKNKGIKKPVPRGTEKKETH